MTRVAIIDIGTNSVRLLVGDANKDTVVPVYNGLQTTRLGQGMGNKCLLPEAVSRTLKAILDMQAICREMSAEMVVAAATSAVRDAKNREWFLQEVWNKAGIQVRVLEGEEEAYYSYLGVSVGFGEDLSDAVILDVGGGSTELTWTRDGQLINRSVNAGAVRMTEGGHDDSAIADVLRGVLDELLQQNPRRLIGVGGTVTTLAAMDMQLKIYDPRRVHGYRLETARIYSLLEELLETGPEGRKGMPGLQPARADIIVAGTRILLEVVKRLKFDFIRVSEADLMVGLAVEAIRCRNKISHK